MSTKIKLESPYKEDWKFGYVVVNPEGRETLILFNNENNRSSTQYARYLLAVKLGRYLTKDEQVDHIDNNKTNNDITNLQLISPKDNLYKQSNKKGAKQWVRLRCPSCKEVFVRNKTNTQLMKCFKNRVSCCSHECATEWRKIRHLFSAEQIEEISATQVLEEFRVDFK